MRLTKREEEESWDSLRNEFQEKESRKKSKAF